MADRTGTTSDESYTYDSNGNRTSGGTTVTTNNRLASDGTYRYVYDDEGNRTVRFVDNGDGQLGAGDTQLTEYAWDNRNRLTRVASRATFAGAATQTVDYVYDAFDQMVKRTVDGDGNPSTTADIDQTFYLYEQGQVALEFHKTGSGSLAASDLAHRYLWGPAVDELMADEQVTSLASAGQNLWALSDQEGSVRDVVDNSGTVRIHRNFDSYGNTTAETHYNAGGSTVTAGQTGFVTLVFGFTGRFLDSVTGLQNNHERWYDPNSGRWLSEDPLGFAAGDPNLTRYCGNSPTNYIDPAGLESFYIDRQFHWHPNDNNLHPKNTCNSHSFIATARDGKVEHTYSWCNDESPFPPSKVYKDAPEDLNAAQEALDTGIGLWPVANGQLDPYIDRAYNHFRRMGPKSPTNHGNWWVARSCKSEANRLIEEAKEQQHRDKWGD